MPIEWRTLEPSTFDVARETDRPVLLVLTVPWCAHCRDLMENTFSAPEVEALVRDSFVPAHVDAERRPDVNERYGTGAWPTIAFLTPGGELITHENYLRPDELVARARRVLDFFATHREEIEESVQSSWMRKADEAGRRPEGRLNPQMVVDVVDAIYEKFDRRYGGWGETSKFPHPEAIDFALVQVAKRGDERMREVVTVTLDRMMEGRIHDPVDGGFFRFSRTPDWSEPNYEKVLDSNVQRMRCYLEAYQLFGNEAYRRTAEGVVEWMLTFMLDPETGAFFGSQHADADYYLMDKEERRRAPSPRVDRTIYTNWNALAVSNLLKASVVLERSELRDVGMGTLNFLLENLYGGEGTVYHYWDDTYHLPGMLSDQAYLIRALVDASQHTGNADLLLPAEAIAERAFERQRAPGGGFYDIVPDPRYPGSMRRRNRSILENSVIAEALVRLSYLSRRRDLHEEAVRTLEAFAGDYKEYGYYVAGFGRAVDLILYEPLTVTIVGEREDPRTDALRRAALSTYVPSRIVQTLDPRHDPILLGRSGFEVRDEPTAYVGVGRTTQAAETDPGALLDRIRSIRL